MLNPIEASERIKNDYIGYLSTALRFADRDYNLKFKSALEEEGAVAKGPYLELNDSFEKGKSIEQLIEEGVCSPRFRQLEPAIEDDKKKEVPLQRTLWAHQEKALRKAVSSTNMVVTTGTGSGKTECFVLPIINHLLSEEDSGALGSGVRAILVYPMNALVNDQMGRLRAILRDYPSIRFGVYNGSTPDELEKGIEEYGKLYKDDSGKPLAPLPNEVVSRDVMRQDPPHILITNYAMLEYMLLRPNDGAVFERADLRFLVLDEAHTYRGATGIETSLLLRRLKARVGSVAGALHILTSATLGGEDSDSDIVAFAETLCDAPFTPDGIIRSITVPVDLPDESKDYPMEMFADLAKPKKPMNLILEDYGITVDASLPEHEILFEICSRAAIYRSLREVATKPMTLKEITESISEVYKVSENDIANLVSVASLAKRGKTPLVKARYHMFVKALEGAYTALTDEKLFSLTRQTEIDYGDNSHKAFEICVCDDCGRHGVAGKDVRGMLEFSSGSWDPGLMMFVPSRDNEAWEDFDDSEGDSYADNGIGEDDYLVCPECGEFHHESNRFEFKCGHETQNLIKARRAKVSAAGKHKCPCCGQGSMRQFYIGYDAATSVLGTSLFESLPESETKLQCSPAAASYASNPFAISAPAPTVETVRHTRQFLAFSDSRSEAAYFASKMGSEYQEFLRRRGVWHVLNDNRESLSQQPWELDRFVRALTSYFDENRTFAEAGDSEGVVLTDISEKQAWIAVLNELVNSRRSTSLSSLGAVAFLYKSNENEQLWQTVSQSTGYDKTVLKGLFDRLVLGIAQNGAIDVKGFHLNDAEKEYLFYSVKSRAFKKEKTEADKGLAHLHGWLPTARKNGSRYANSRILATMRALSIGEEDAMRLLGLYWDGVLASGTEHSLEITGGEGVLKPSSFLITVGSDNRPVFECTKCGKRTMINCADQCETVKCDGKLEECNREDLLEGNHYARLYSEKNMAPLHIKEHTAQLGRQQQRDYQDMFVEKKLNALSCSTTFEMGVDVGDLEATYLRNMPPSPANYVQRAGRAGRGAGTAAFSLTFAKLGSHDFTFYDDPRKMVSGEIGVPVLTIENEKVILRHVFAIVLSSFFVANEDVYSGNDAHVLLNADGYDRLLNYLNGRPAELQELIRRSIPEKVHGMIDVDGWGWVEKMVGDQGVLSSAVEEHRGLIKWCQGEIERAYEERDGKRASDWEYSLKSIRRAPEDKLKRAELIEFLVRSNVLPKYGFPVDVVELHQNAINPGMNKVQLMRDLQLAVAEYAPGSQVVADGLMYTSRFIRKMPHATGDAWEEAYVAVCPNDSCKTWNYRTVAPRKTGEECVACRQIITNWHKAIEPRKGFVTEPTPKQVRSKPDRLFRSDDFYIGDPNRKVIETRTFMMESGGKVQVESSSNDSLLVVCKDDFFVCDRCGFAVSEGDSRGERDFKFGKPWLEKTHDAPWGRKCSSKNLQKKKLCHSFKTDVVRLTFATPYAKNGDTMLSVMYALLEGVSSALRIERADIKGCLHRVRLETGMCHEIMLYDAVAGGAGHVRRLVDDDFSALGKVISAAIERLESCDCSPSCYSCLRNYQNRMIHDKLDRRTALRFLKNWDGKAVVISDDDFRSSKSDVATEQVDESLCVEPEPKTGAYTIGNLGDSFDGWNDFFINVPDESKGFFECLMKFDVPAVTGIYPVILSPEGGASYAICAWANQKVLLFNEGESVAVDGWNVFEIPEITPLQLSDVLKG